VTFEISPNPLLGTGKGLDHIVIAVRDLEQSSQDYSSVLGFEVAKGGRHPGGTENAVSYFSNRSYIELLALTDPGNQITSEIASFLRVHEGALGCGLEVSSASECASYLRENNFDIDGPSAGTITPEGGNETPKVLWRAVGFKPKKVQYLGSFFFIEYDHKAREEFNSKHPELAERRRRNLNQKHPNTSLELSSVWLAVDNLAAASNEFERAGFEKIESVTAQNFKSEAIVLDAGVGYIVLIEADHKAQNLPSLFLDERGSACAIIGISLRVSDLAKARTALKTRTNVPPYAGVFGTSMQVGPTEPTHGIWIEFFED
jgi:catechol 2,3-dioxygenase-like lactoylglutathione lyase family enzyme